MTVFLSLWALLPQVEVSSWPHCTVCGQMMRASLQSDLEEDTAKHQLEHAHLVARSSPFLHLAVMVSKDRFEIGHA